MKNLRAAIQTTLVLLLLVGLLAPPLAWAQNTLSAQALTQLDAIYQEKASWTPAQQKMDSHLIFESQRRLGRSFTPGFPSLRSSTRFDASDRALVDIKATVTQDVLNAITQLGGEVVLSVPQFDAIRAAVPLEFLETLASHTDIRSLRQADIAMTNKINTSEGDTAHRAATARMDFGVDGTGISIGVLSDSVDALLSLQASGDLPPVVTVLPGQSGNPGSSEGTAMLEIVHDLAPGSDLFFATAFNGQAGFAQNILNLQGAGCKVIVDDIFYFFEPIFQDGIIAQAVETVAANGVSYFSAAGNSGNLNDGTSGVFEGDFNGVTTSTPAGTLTLHDYGSMTVTNTIQDVGFVYVLQWADPMGGSGNDYDLFLFDPGFTTVLDFSTTVQNGNGDPIEGMGAFSSDVGAQLAVVKDSGEDRFFHLNTLRGRLSFATEGQTSGHSTTENSFGVAAVDISSAPGPDGNPFVGSEPVESFSSDGPRRMFFEADGTPITPGNFSSTGGKLLAKPDLTAADGVATATPFFDPFFGTSAAAPHAAALAALLIEQGIFTEPDHVRFAFSDTAIDIEAPGFDRDSGAGIVDINAALDIDCSFALSSPSELVPAEGIVNGVVSFTSTCPWTVVTSSPFISITSASAGSGNSAVAYTVAPNNGAGRIGTIIIGGESFEVTQLACAIPASVVDPVSQAGCLGGSIIFNALGSGTGPLGIQWQVNTGGGFMDLNGENGPSLTVNNITQNMDGYQYHAVFFNACGNMATVPAVLTVGQPGTPASVGASDGLFADRVRVQWSAVPGATSYRVFRSAQSNGSGAVDLSGPITTLLFDDFTATTGPGSGCTPTEVGIVYQYFVIASNPCGDGSQSPSDAGSIADPAKISASIRPEHVGDFGMLLLTLAAMYAFQRRRKAMHALTEKP